MVVIESGIPIPEKNILNRPEGLAATLRLMAVGDSVLTADIKQARVLRMTARRVGAKLTQRQVEGGIRVWRVA